MQQLSRGKYIILCESVLTGALVHWCAGSMVRWFTGALVHWCTGSLVHWCTGSLVHWCTGALVHWCAGSPDSLVHLVHSFAIGSGGDIQFLG